MRKYVIGFLAGAVFSVCLAVAIFANVPTAFANEIKSLIGREVQGEFVLTIGGKQLENKAIVIDGTSFAPVREIGEALENKVDFDMEKGITLTKKEEPKVIPTPSTTPTPTKKPIDYSDITPENATLEQAKDKYQRVYTDINSLKMTINLSVEGPEKEKAKTDLPVKEAELEKWAARITELGGEVPK